MVGNQKCLEIGSSIWIGNDNSVNQVISPGTNSNGLHVGAETMSGGYGIVARGDSDNYTLTAVSTHPLTLTADKKTWTESTTAGRIRLKNASLVGTSTVAVCINLKGNTKVLSNGTQTGIMSAANDVVAFASDKRLKENIVNISSPLEKIKQLRGVYFDWKEKTDEGESIKDLGFIPPIQKGEIGMIAQEVEKVIPQAITDAPFDEREEGDKYKTIKYDRLIPLLVECINEQQKQIDELKNKIKP